MSDFETRWAGFVQSGEQGEALIPTLLAVFETRWGGFVQPAPGEETLIPLLIAPPAPAPAPGGGGGGGASPFVHVQSVPATEWIVNHNLGFRPAVSVFTIGGVELPISEVVHTTLNQFRVLHNTALSGSAQGQ